MATSNKQSNLDKWLALKQKKQGISSPQKISVHPEGVEVPLSYGQQRLWLLQQLHADSPFYNYAHQYHFRGVLAVEQLRASLQVVADRHALTTTAFRQNTAGEIIQYQATGRPLVCPLVDLGEYAPEEREQQRQELLTTVRTYVFDLEKEPLLRAWIIRHHETKYTLVLLLHHIIGDRGSLQIFNEELAVHYRTAIGTESLTWPKLSLRYADFAYWQRQREVPENQVEYWLKQLAAPLPFLALPTDYPPPPQPSFRGQTLRSTLPPELSQQLKALAKQQQATLFMLGLAAFQALLYRYTAQTDICIGTPISNRNRTELAGIVGFFNETVVLRSDLSQAADFTQLLAQVKRHTLAAFSNQDVPFDLLVQRLQPERQAGLNPLFQAMFVMNEQAVNYDFGAALELTEESLEMGVAKFDLTCFLTDTPTGLELALEYAADRFEAATVARMLEHLEVLLTGVADQADTPLTKLSLLSAAARNELLHHSNSPYQPVPAVATILALIEQQIRTQPEQTAAVFGDAQLTYTELDQRANALRIRLRELPLPSLANQFVALAVSPSIDMVVGILGILRAGAAYLPIDPEYPAARIEYMLDDAEPVAVVTTSQLSATLSTKDLVKIQLEELAPSTRHESAVPPEQANDLAYMIYTSGSTGQPKGVPISHRNLLYSTTARFQYYDQQPGTFLLLSSFAFDSSVAGIFWTLASGGTLVLAPRRVEQDVAALGQLVQSQQVTHTLMLPSLYGLLLEYAPARQLTSLEVVIVAGEACSTQVVRQHFGTLARTTLYNEYGPTEATVWSTAHQIRPMDADGLIPIGKPIPNYTNYILDAQQQLVPFGLPGELYIGGPGLSSGYWNRPELNDTSFLANPFGPEQLYRTGDRVRWRPDGTIEFLGRVDNQVKVRGHRIELGEIERQLLTIPPVQEAVVLADEQQGLLAWVTTVEDFDPQAGLQWLRRRLPNYMIPGRLTQVDQFPRLPNGKLDRPQLLALRSQQPTIQDASEPQDPLAIQLLQIWRKVLHQPTLTVADNFFTSGGDSLQSIKVIAQARRADIPLSPNLLFEYPTIQELARFLKTDATADSTWESVTRLGQGNSDIPLFCIHSGAGHIFFYRDLANYLNEDYTLYALQAQGLEAQDHLPNSIEEMAAHYIEEIRRIQPRGPYRLLGTCFSNAVGLEMAHQLHEAGETINRLIFVDSGPAYLQSLRKREGKRTLHRFGQLIQRGDWRGIAKKLRNRSIVAAQKVSQPFKSASAQRLQRTIDNLNDLYGRYDWTPFPGDIYFIRSSEFAERSDKDYHLEQWTTLAGGTLNTRVVPGHHLTLFAEPEVRGLAEAIGGILRED